MRFGVKTRATTLRCHVCSGGSFTMRSGVSFSKPSMVTPPALLHVTGSAWAACTSAWRDNAQKSNRSLWYTGASSRRRW